MRIFGQIQKRITLRMVGLGGGLVSAVIEWWTDHGYQAQVKRLGISNEASEGMCEQIELTS